MSSEIMRFEACQRRALDAIDTAKDEIEGENLQYSNAEYTLQQLEKATSYVKELVTIMEGMQTLEEAIEQARVNPAATTSTENKSSIVRTSGEDGNERRARADQRIAVEIRAITAARVENMASTAAAVLRLAATDCTCLNLKDRDQSDAYVGINKATTLLQEMHGTFKRFDEISATLAAWQMPKEVISDSSSEVPL